MSFNGTESSADLGSPFELYLFRYGDEMPDEVTFDFNALPLPLTAPDAKVTYTAVSPNGKVVAVVYDAAPYLRVYRKGTDELFSLAVTGAPEAQPTCVAFSHDSSHMVVGCKNQFDEFDVELPNIYFYSITYSGEHPISLAFFVHSGGEPNRPVLGDGQLHCMSYSTDGQHLLVGHDSFPYVTFYSRSGNTYITFDGLVENAPGPALSIDFASADTCVIANADDAPIMYHRAGASYTRAATVPMTLAGGETIQAARFHPAGDRIVVCRSQTPYISFYSRDENTLAPMIEVIGGGPTGKAMDAYFDELGEGLVVTMQTSPYAMSFDVKTSVVVRTDEMDSVVLSSPAGPIAGADNDHFFIGVDFAPFLYFIKREVTLDDGASGYYAYTNAERDMPVVIDGYGTVDFKAIAINRDAYKSNGKSDPTNMAIRMPVNTDLSNLFLPYPPPQPVGISIFQGHHDDVDGELLLVWSGKILSVSREGSEAVLNCDNNIVSMTRLGLRRNYQFGCPYVLYGSLCKASRENASVDAVVVSVDDGALVLTAGWYGGRNPQDFAGGYMSWRSKIGTEYRTISAVSVGGAITYVGPLRNINPGTEITITLGCNHQRSHCSGLHNNINNFGGQPWIPLKNPVKYHPFW